MERKIGEIFEYNGEWYQCLIGNRCCECDFSSNNITCDIHGTLICTCKGRSDETSVVFKKLEKVGDPFIGKVHIQLQRYKIYTEPIIDPAEKFGYVNEKNTIAIEIKQNKEDMEEYRMHDAKEDIPEFDKVVDECLFGEDKLNLKPFDLEAAKAGKTVCTRDGRKARIICFDRDWDMHIVALVTDPLGESVHYYLSNGKVDFDKQNDEDLMMLPEKRIGWINVNKDAGLFKSKEEAERDCTKDYATVRVEFEI